MTIIVKPLIYSITPKRYMNTSTETATPTTRMNKQGLIPIKPLVSQEVPDIMPIVCAEINNTDIESS